MEIFTEQLKKEHILSRIDARLKLVVAIFILIMVISHNGFLFPLFVFSFSTLLYFGMKMPLRTFILRLAEPTLIASILVIIKLFSGHDELFSLNIAGFVISGYRDGLIDGLLIASRIAGAVSIIILFEFATPFTEIMAGLSWLGIPKIFIEILVFAYRYIFILIEDAMVIYNAQKNRLGYSSIKRGISSFGILTGSLTLKAFEHSQNITTAMLQRGYDGSLPVLKHKPFKSSETVAAIVLLIAMGVIWKI
jgi:cobalt/nickel transport system permease protein